MTESFLFSSESNSSGPNVLIFGAIHGDEHCGPIAIMRVMEKIRSGALPILKGSVRFVPICNPEAYSAQQRVLKENLNRVFHVTEDPQTDEGKLANELCALVDECDVLLDIHSSFVPAPANVFVDYPTPKNLAFAKALRPDFLIFDWPAVYKDNPFDFDSWTTDRYAHEAGKIGLLMECGKHDDPLALMLAEGAIMRTLAHFKLIEPLTERPMIEPQSVYMTQVFRRESDEDRFTKNWHHLEAVLAGTVVAQRAMGEEIAVKEDSYIIFPKDYAIPGGEWFYLAVPHKKA